MNSNYSIQLFVSLDKSDPVIWRQIQVPDSITFFDLHHIIQISMGWKNSHLFEFRIGDYRVRFEDEEMDGSEDVADADQVTLDTLLTKEGMEFNYVYDFGDNWMHAIKIEKLERANPEQLLPFCTGGEGNCPPEDCGGIPGFYHLLEVLKDKNHEEYEDMRTWTGRYNPNKFNIQKVNRELPKFRSYMKRWK